MRNKLIYKHQNGYVIQSDNTRVDPIVLQPRVPNFTKLNQSKLGKAMFNPHETSNFSYFLTDPSVIYQPKEYSIKGRELLGVGIGTGVLSNYVKTKKND